MMAIWVERYFVFIIDQLRFVWLKATIMEQGHLKCLYVLAQSIIRVPNIKSSFVENKDKCVKNSRVPNF